MSDKINGFASSSIYQQYGLQQQERLVGGDNWGKDTFLRILVAQMSNQNPMEPMNDTEFISQMAQFSSLEQMQQLNATMTNSQAYNLIGKTISAEFSVLAADGKTYEMTSVVGMIEGAFMFDNQVFLMVGEYNVPYSAVKEVYGNELMAGMNNAASLLMQSASMIGKYVEGTITEGEGENAQTINVRGTVESIFVKNSVVYAKVDGKDMPIGRITVISANAPPPGTPTDPEDPADPGDPEAVG